MRIKTINITDQKKLLFDLLRKSFSLMEIRRMRTVAQICLMMSLLLGCQKKVSVAVNNELFESGVSQGTLDNPALVEVSGLAGSINNPGYLWVHNDSGDKARLFLLDKQGKHKATVWLANATNRDWEDIAVGPGPEEGKSYVYIGDIGDNDQKYKFKHIYRIEEPVIDLHTTSDTTLTQVDRIEFKLPDGPQDTELLMMDPSTRDLYTVSKRKKKINLYRLPYPHTTTATMTAEIVLRQDLSKVDGKHISQQGEETLINGYNSQYYYQVVAGDISHDGQEVLLKSYSAVYYWKKSGQESLVELLAKDPIQLPYVAEPQGEAIGFDAEGMGYFTISEKRGEALPQVIFYKRK